MTDAAEPADLATRTLDEAWRVIAAEGVEALSLRAVARRLGVSHQAPYRHYPSRDHLLAALVARMYRDFAAALAAVPDTGDPFADLGAMGRRYVDHALAHPAEYRLMFFTPLPDPARHPALRAESTAALALLVDRLARLPLRPGRAGADVRGDAVFIWAALHGLVSLLLTEAGAAAGVAPADRGALVARVLARIGDAVEP